MSFDWTIIWKYRELFLNGIWLTLLLTLSGVGIGLMIGLIFGMGKLSRFKLISWPATVYVDFFRGTPLYVQILLIHFAVLPTLFPGESKGPIVSGIVALSLNSGAYIAEIFRAGINSISRGQMEAARSLGMTHGQAMINVILPQAFKRMIPPLGNEFIALLKDSSLLAVIAAQELAYAARTIQGATLRAWEPWLTVAFLYFIIYIILSQLVNALERRLNYDRRS